MNTPQTKSQVSLPGIALMPVHQEFGQPHYNGRHHIGIIREWSNRRIIMRYVYRGDGQPMFPLWFDEARHFSHRYAAVRRGEKWYFINEFGKVACRHRFIEVGAVDHNRQVVVRHHSYLDLMTRLPAWMIYTLPTVV